MSNPLSWIRGTAALLAGGIVAAPALAQERASHDLVWEREQGAESCPDRATFVDSIRTRIGYDPFQQGSVRRLEVRLSRAPARWRAELRVLENGVERGSQGLEAQGADCNGLYAAIVAVASVMLDEASTPPAAEPSAQAEPPKSDIDRTFPEPPEGELTKPEQTAPPVPPNAAPRGAPFEWRPQPGPRRTAPSMPWALGLEIAQDYQLIFKKEDVCGPDQSQSIACFEQNDTTFDGRPQPSTNNRITSGLLEGNVRLLGSLQHLLTDRFGVELRVGWAFRDGPPEEKGNMFLPWHVEAGARYWLADGNLAVRGYVGAGLGIAQFDAKFRVTVADCGPRSEVPSDVTSECLLRQREGVPKSLVGYQKLGLLFVPVRVGAVWRFAGQQALTAGLAVNFTLLSYGIVFDPNIGYSVAF